MGRVLNYNSNARDVPRRVVRRLPIDNRSPGAPRRAVRHPLGVPLASDMCRNGHYCPFVQWVKTRLPDGIGDTHSRGTGPSPSKEIQGHKAGTLVGSQPRLLKERYNVRPAVSSGLSRRTNPRCNRLLRIRNGSPVVNYGGDEVHFDPGSSGVHILDPDTLEHRPSYAPDLIKIIKLAEMLSQYDAQSTAVVCNEIPKEIGDLYRLYLVLLYSHKPIITGAFSIKTLQAMIDMLAIFAGGRLALAGKPQAVFFRGGAEGVKRPERAQSGARKFVGLHDGAEPGQRLGCGRFAEGGAFVEQPTGVTHVPFAGGRL